MGDKKQPVDIESLGVLAMLSSSVVDFTLKKQITDLECVNNMSKMFYNWALLEMDGHGCRVADLHTMFRSVGAALLMAHRELGGKHQELAPEGVDLDEILSTLSGKDQKPN